jgi:hypothetical protein
MLVHSETYITRCLDIGILTEEPIRKYPLRASNLAMLLKAYAVSTHKPYTIDKQRYYLLQDYKLYMTDEGLLWLYDIFNGHSLNFLKRTFQYLFINVKDIDEVTTCYAAPWLANFRGEVGEQPKAGSKQAAVLVRSYGKDHKIKKEFNFPELRLAREAVLDLTRFYPLGEFKLYRIRKLTKQGKETFYREEVPLLLESSKRGLSNNLPNVRR